MGLDLWFREDVARIIGATFAAMEASAGSVAPADVAHAAAYRQGFEDALRAVAVGFGVVEAATGAGIADRRNGHNRRMGDIGY